MSSRGVGTLLIDDLRHVEANKTARNYFNGIEYLDRGLPWETLILDHDLASYDDKGNEKTGYDITKWLAEHPDLRPDKIYLITDSSVGLQNMAAILSRIGYRQLGRWFYLGEDDE